VPPVLPGCVASSSARVEYGIDVTGQCRKARAPRRPGGSGATAWRGDLPSLSASAKSRLVKGLPNKKTFLAIGFQLD
jgi:hypothetical protein